MAAGTAALILVPRLTLRSSGPCFVLLASFEIQERKDEYPLRILREFITACSNGDLTLTAELVVTDCERSKDTANPCG
jgi:hypothetical protein